MSEKYPGGFITKNAPQPTGGESGSAPGIWTLDQALQYTKAGTWPIQPLPKYIEDVFSTWLYTGNGSTQTITNGIDLLSKSGLVWIKDRTSSTYWHCLYDTIRGATKQIYTNRVDGQDTESTSLTSFNTNGFSLGAYIATNTNNNNYASWSFRKQTKFFDLVSWTGNGTGARAISHNLGSQPGCIFIKRVDFGSSANWIVYHRSLVVTSGIPNYLVLNDTGSENGGNADILSSVPTSTTFSVGTNQALNANGGTYVAYLFAHNAGGFGITESDNVISCGSFTHNGTSTSVNLGYEPQWMIIKRSDDVGAWELYDNMRGFGVGPVLAYLYPNYAFAETTNSRGGVTATGVTWDSGLSAGTYIYIAIRRGPMKTPTTGTSVFYPYVTASVSNVGSTSGTMYNSQIVTDHAWQKAKGGTDGWYLGARLTGTAYMKSETTAAESTSAAIVWDSNRGAWAFSDPNYGLYCFKRAPGFFDVVCYTGTGVARTVSHNLGVAPELMIVRSRSNASNWEVYAAPLGATKYLRLDLTSAAGTYSDFWNDTTPTSSVFSVATDADVNGSGRTYIAYLFASVTGVSKVGSYTGTGTTQQINCGFTNGSRFVLIKRTDSTGDWYIWDSARGIVAGNDPYLLLNSTAAEVTNTDYVDTFSSGFEISSTAPAAINANGGTFIFLAIA